MLGEKEDMSYPPGAGLDVPAGQGEAVNRRAASMTTFIEEIDCRERVRDREVGLFPYYYKGGHKRVGQDMWNRVEKPPDRYIGGRSDGLRPAFTTGHAAGMG